MISIVVIVLLHDQSNNSTLGGGSIPSGSSVIEEGFSVTVKFRFCTDSLCLEVSKYRTFHASPNPIPQTQRVQNGQRNVSHPPLEVKALF